MKLPLQTSLRLVSLTLLLVLGATAPALAQNAKLEMGQLDYLGAKASETVDVNIDERLIQLAAKFLSSKEPDEMKIKELVKSLKGVYVKRFEFERDGEYSQADIQSIRSQLANAAWTRLLNVRSKREGSVEVYLMSNATQVGGLVVLAYEPKELTIVNIIGPVDLEKLSQIEGQFGIPDLGIEITKPKKN